MPALVKKNRNGKIYYYVVENSRVDGKLTTETIEAVNAYYGKDKITLSEAKDRLAFYRVSGRKKRMKIYTFSELAAAARAHYEYQAKVGEISPKSHDAFGFHIMRAEKLFGKIQAKDITTLHLERLKNEILGDKMTRNTLRLNFVAVRNTFKFGVISGIVSGMPMFPKLAGVVHKEPEVCTRDEITAAISRANHNQRYYVLLLILTGMRPREFMLLPWSRVDFKNNTVDYVGYAKNKRGRKVRYPEAAMNVFREWRDLNPRAELVCPYTRSDSANHEIQKLGYVYVEDAETGKSVRTFEFRIIPKMLRSTFISWMLMAGVDVLTVANMCGTSVGVIQKHYAKFIPNVYEAAMAKHPLLQVGVMPETTENFPTFSETIETKKPNLSTKIR